MIMGSISDDSDVFDLEIEEDPNGIDECIPEWIPMSPRYSKVAPGTS